MRVQTIPIDRPNPAPYNPRIDLKPGEPEYEKLKRSIKEFDCGERGGPLMAVTVMQKIRNYDPDNANWFWVKYMPDGTLAKNPKGMLLAGRVAKGMPAGCIACHGNAAGGDYLFVND